MAQASSCVPRIRRTILQFHCRGKGFLSLSELRARLNVGPGEEIYGFFFSELSPKRREAWNAIGYWISDILMHRRPRAVISGVDGDVAKSLAEECALMSIPRIAVVPAERSDVLGALVRSQPEETDHVRRTATVLVEAADPCGPCADEAVVDTIISASDRVFAFWNGRADPIGRAVGTAAAARKPREVETVQTCLARHRSFLEGLGLHQGFVCPQ